MENLFTLAALQFYLVTLAGMIAHALKKWVMREIEGELIHWYTVNRRYTAGVFMAAMGATVAGISTGLYTDFSDSAQVIACFMFAYGVDGLNKQ